jgi:hypothetical protein
VPGRRDVEDDGDARLEERRVDGRRGRRGGFGVVVVTVTVTVTESATVVSFMGAGGGGVAK